MNPLAKSPATGWFMRFGLGLVIVVLLLTKAKPEEFLRTLKNVSPLVLTAALVFYWLSQCLSAAKWRLLLQSRGAEFSFFECARLYLLGMFCSLFLPTTIGGDSVRAIITGPRCSGITVAASAILIERLTGLIALLTIGSIGVALWGTNSASFGSGILVRVFVVLGLIALLFGMARSFAYALEEKTTGRASKIISQWAKLHREIDFYAQRDRWPTLAFALLISFAFQTAQVAINIFLARVAGLQTPTTTFLWLVPMLSLTTMIPIGIGGLGVREAAAIAILGNQEQQGTILAWSLLMQATVWLSSLPGGLFLSEWRRTR